MDSPVYNIMGLEVEKMTEELKCHSAKSFDYYTFRINPKNVPIEVDIADIYSFIQNNAEFQFNMSFLYDMCIVNQNCRPIVYSDGTDFWLTVAAMPQKECTPGAVFTALKSINDVADEFPKEPYGVGLRSKDIPPLVNFDRVDMVFNGQLCARILCSRESTLFISPLTKMLRGFIVSSFEFNIQYFDGINGLDRAEVTAMIYKNMYKWSIQSLDNEIYAACYNIVKDSPVFFTHTTNILHHAENTNKELLFVMSVINRIRNTRIEYFNSRHLVLEQTDDWWDFEKNAIGRTDLFNHLLYTIVNSKEEINTDVYTFVKKVRKVGSVDDFVEQIHIKSMAEVLSALELKDRYKMVELETAVYESIPQVSNKRIQFLAEEGTKFAKYSPRFIVTLPEVTKSELEKHITSHYTLQGFFGGFKYRKMLTAEDRVIFKIMKRDGSEFDL